MSAARPEPARARILVVEDSSVFREMQGLLLGQAGYLVSGFENPQSALDIAATEHFELVIIDYELPQMNGQQFMHALRKIQPDIAVIFVSGSLTLELAIQLSHQGVAGIFNKPANPKTLLEKVNETLARHAARDTAARVGSGSPLAPEKRGKTKSPFAAATTASVEPTADRLAYTPRFVLGNSDPFREFSHHLWKVRDFRAVLLLQGEVGSPFERLARELAEISMFRDGPIMVCERSKFEPRRLIEVLAPSLLSHDAGTLVVTGVESFSAAQQKTLENLISGRDVFLPFARRFRLVIAGTQALPERVDEGTFNETLYYKISSLTLAVPELREMRSDIIANARHILAQHREAGHPGTPLEISPDAQEWMESQDWPGNFDELARTVLNGARFATGNLLTLDALAAGWPADGDTPETAPLPDASAPSAVESDSLPIEETRPPFPISSALEAEPVAIASSVSKGTVTSDVARVSAKTLFSRATTPVQPLATQSLFRPGSKSYHFGQRLTSALAEADAAAAD